MIANTFLGVMELLQSYYKCC